jgi:dihydrodiol dehydrogenase / D-xylose 1-dehydrogenase (NADP)
MTERLRWGIVGTGNAARNFAAGIRRLPDAELRGVVSRDRARAVLFARECGVTQACASIEDLLDDRDVDLVYIATPNSLHRTLCIAALEASKAVLCEKPFAVDAEEARDVIAAARRQRLFCMEAMWTRFLPAVRETRALVDSQVAGEIRLMSASLGYACAADATSPLFRREMGGGALLDLGVYAISFVSLVLGQPSSVVSGAYIGATGVDEQVSAVLSFASGAQAIIAVSLRADLPSEAVIVGTEGQIRVHAPLYRPEKVSVTKAPAPGRPAPTLPSGIVHRVKGNFIVRGAYHQASRLLTVLPGRSARVIVRPVEGNGYGYEALEAMRCVREGRIESPLLPHDETIAVMETADAVRKAWANYRVPLRS